MNKKDINGGQEEVPGRFDGVSEGENDELSDEMREKMRESVDFEEEKQQRKGDQERFARLREILSKGKEGYTVTINRKRPAWCKGLIEEYEFDPESPVSWRDIQEDCGGGHYKITLNNSFGQYVGSTSISIVGQPKQDGRVVRNPAEPVPQKESGLDNMSVISEMVRAFMEPMKSQNDMIAQELRELRKRDPVVQSSGMDMSSMKDMIKLVGSIIDLSKDLGGGQESLVSEGSENPMLDMVANLLGRKMEAKAASKQPVDSSIDSISNEELLQAVASRFQGQAGKAALMQVLSGASPRPPGQGGPMGHSGKRPVRKKPRPVRTRKPEVAASGIKKTKRQKPRAVARKKP